MEVETVSTGVCKVRPQRCERLRQRVGDVHRQCEEAADRGYERYHGMREDFQGVVVPLQEVWRVDMKEQGHRQFR
jgi:hypothetical protein